MKVKLWSVGLAAQLSVLALSANVFGASEILTLSTTGAISAAPEWQDGDSVPISAVSFDFGGLVAGPAGADVDSANQVVKLVNATAYPATVALVRPSSCSIGATLVTNSHVHFMGNGSAVTSDSSVSIASNATQTYGLRFSSAGSYGDKSGSVSCVNPGSLTYTY
jgi:hypothetical protein